MLIIVNVINMWDFCCTACVSLGIAEDRTVRTVNQFRRDAIHIIIVKNVN